MLLPKAIIRSRAARGDSKVMSEPIISVKHITKTYKMGDFEVHALRGINVDIDKGEFVAIMGASGYWKVDIHEYYRMS